MASPNSLKQKWHGRYTQCLLGVTEPRNSKDDCYKVAVIRSPAKVKRGCL